MVREFENKLASKLTDEIEQLLGLADTSVPGLFILHAHGGKIGLCRRIAVPKNCHVIMHLSRGSVKDGLTAEQWSRIHNKIIILLLNGGLKL